MVTGKMHESWLEMLMGGDGEAIGVEAPRGLVVAVARDNSCVCEGVMGRL